MHDTLALLEPTDFPAIDRISIDTLQINIGLKCNQACLHCHVNASPYRKEKMSRETLGIVLGFLQKQRVKALDITGGAPELHPGFRSLVADTRALGIHVIDRCNLTILEEPGQEDLAEFLAAMSVEIIASLPCYTEGNVDKQRGDGVFESSIRALKHLNSLGYGQPGSGLILNLVYNPQGPSLPPPQQQLEEDYKKELMENFAISFDRLFSLANMPINRFGSTLVSQGKFEDYMGLLRSAHDEKNIPQLMCRTMLSVDWQGRVYDCDFNQMLGLQVEDAENKPLYLADIVDTGMQQGGIRVKDHCYACTAGQGSSCGGALSGH